MKISVRRNQHAIQILTDELKLVRRGITKDKKPSFLEEVIEKADGSLKEHIYVNTSNIAILKKEINYLASITKKRRRKK